MSYPESIGVEYSIDVPLELTFGREGLYVELGDATPSGALPIPGDRGDVMVLTIRGGDVTFQIGDSSVRASRGSNATLGGTQPVYLLPLTGKHCSHISFLSLAGTAAVIVNCYRRGS